MIELSTPIELIIQMAQLIEDNRRMQNLQQKELVSKANIPLPTYKEFIYNKKISFVNLLKLLIALRLFDNIAGLLKKQEIISIEELKQIKPLLKRIVK